MKYGRQHCLRAVCALSVLLSHSGAAAQQVTNVFADTDIRQALGDISAAAKVSIIPDDSVNGTISVELKDVPLEKALDIVLAPGGYSWKKENGYYLVGKAEPNSPNFLRFATTRTYKPNYSTAEKIAALLNPAMSAYIKVAPGERLLTITASKQMIERIMDDIKLLDVPPVRLVMEALVTEVSSDTLNQYDFSWVWKQFGFDSGTESVSFKYARAAQEDVATMKLLLGTGQAELRANPRIMTVEGKEALVEVAQESYFLVQQGSNAFAYNTIQQIKTGISLKMTPYLAENGDVTVQLIPEVSDTTGTSGPNGLPVNTVRRANTTVRVHEGETIIIGGMSYENKRRRDRRVPLLSDLPIIGGLFRFYRTESSKTEVVIMITPRIIRDGDLLEPNSPELKAKLPKMIPIGPKGVQPPEKESGPKALPDPRVSLNEGTLRELEILPGVGTILARRIIEYRESTGGFKSAEELGQIQGFTPETIARIRDLIRI